MLKRRLLIFAFVSSTVVFGQQMPQFSQYLRNQYMVNPGAAGIYDFLDLTIGGRYQWAGFENAPVSSYLYVSSTLSKKETPKYNPALRISEMPVRNPEVKTGKLKHALGGMVLFDQYGAFQQIKGAITYAIHLPVSANYNISLGTNLGISNRFFLISRAKTLNLMDGYTGPAYDDDTYNEFVQNSSTNTMDLGVGLYFYSDRLFLGVSSEQLTQDLVQFGGSGLANFETQMHLYFTAGYKFQVSENLSLMPAILGKYMTPAPFSLEASLQLEYKEWLWFTLSYRQGIGGYNNPDAIIGMAGLNISERFKFGYSFDYSLSRFNNYTFGGHEVVLGIMLGR